LADEVAARLGMTTSELSAREETPFTLDYWRLNMTATKP